MSKPMKRREVLARLAAIGAHRLRDKGAHTVYECPCGKHRTPVPRHTEITAGVVGNIEKCIACQPKGWLQ